MLPLTGGCFKCGKPGHISRECPDAATNSGKPANNDSSLAFSSNSVLVSTTVSTHAAAAAATTGSATMHHCRHLELSYM